MGISGSEIFLIFLFILIFFGASKIPDFAKTLGKGMREFKRAADDIKREITTETSDITKDFKDIRNDITKTVNSSEIAQDIKEIKDDLHKSVNDSNPVI
jgi:sec-independent protein translocase protein TatA